MKEMEMAGKTFALTSSSGNILNIAYAKNPTTVIATFQLYSPADNYNVLSGMPSYEGWNCYDILVLLKPSPIHKRVGIECLQKNIRKILKKTNFGQEKDTSLLSLWSSVKGNSLHL